MQFLQRFLATAISRVLWLFRRRSILLIFISPTDVYTLITSETFQVCRSRRYIIIAIDLCQGRIRGISTFFSFNPRAIFNATRRDRLAHFRNFLMNFLIRRSRRRCFLHVIVLSGNQGRTVRFFGVRFRGLALCGVIDLGDCLHATVPSLREWSFGSKVKVSPG